MTASASPCPPRCCSQRHSPNLFLEYYRSGANICDNRIDQERPDSESNRHLSSETGVLNWKEQQRLIPRGENKTSVEARPPNNGAQAFACEPPPQAKAC